MRKDKEKKLTQECAYAKETKAMKRKESNFEECL